MSQQDEMQKRVADAVERTLVAAERVADTGPVGPDRTDAVAALRTALNDLKKASRVPPIEAWIEEEELFDALNGEYFEINRSGDGRRVTVTVHPPMRTDR